MPISKDRKQAKKQIEALKPYQYSSPEGNKPTKALRFNLPVDIVDTFEKMSIEDRSKIVLLGFQHINT